MTADANSKRPSIRKKLIFNLIGWCLFMTAAPTVLVYYDAVHEVDELFDASLVQTSKVLNNIVSRKSIEDNKEHFHQYISDQDSVLTTDHHNYEKKVAFQLIDENGVVVKTNYAPTIDTIPTDGEFFFSQQGGYEWISFALYSKENNWWLIVSERDDIRAEIAFDIIRDHVLPLIIFIPILLFLVRFLVNNGFIPLKDVAKQVDNREYKNLTTIDEDKTPEEVEGLLTALNNLLTRLNAAYERESQFVSDASHELRTPLAGILLQTENLLEESDNPEVDKGLLEIKHGIKRLSHLSDQLLASSKAEVNAISDSQSDLALICRQVCQSLSPLTAPKSLQLDIEISPQPCPVNLHSSSALSLVSNLLDNAIRYTPAQGTVSLSCKLTDSTIELCVEDSGPGIPDTLHEQVKQRFYRIKATSAQAKNGSGLGLSIVDQVVKQGGCDWQMSSSSLGGLKHNLRFDLSGK